MALRLFFGAVVVALVLVGCGSSETKRQQCQGMTERAEHDVCVAELRQEEGKSANIPSQCTGMTGAELDGCAAAEQEGNNESATDEVASAEGDAEAHQQPAMPYVATLFLRSEDGYLAEAELRRGRPVHAEVGLENGSLMLGTSCIVDYQRDAAEPFVLRITNTTEGFPASPGIDLIARTPHWELPNVVAEIGYSKEPACMEMTGDAAPSEGSHPAR
jgi:hypothetical protein